MTSTHTSTAHPRRRRAVAALGAALVAVSTMACTADDPEDGTGNSPSGEQPAVNEPVFADELAALPIPEGAEPLGVPSDMDDATAQSFRLPGRTPEQVLTDLVDRLADDGWDLAVPPEPSGTEGYQAEWRKDGRILEASAAPFGDEGAVVSQFSLVLRSLEG